MPDGRKLRGDRTRATVLSHGVELATVKGIQGFSFAELAEASGRSKAGIAALFGSKQDLQTAITGRARQVLHERVFVPVLATPRGLARLAALGTAWIDHLADPDLLGGCFFAAASFELDAQPGLLRDLVREEMGQWIGGIQSMIEDGQQLDEIIASIDAGDEAFAFFSIGMTANAMIQLGVIDQPELRARRVWNQKLAGMRATLHEERQDG